MKTQWHQTATWIGLSTLLAASALVGSSGTIVRGAEAAPAEAALTEARSLAWKFSVRDVFRVQQKSVTTVVDRNDHRYRNEMRTEYLWRVTDVAPDGSVTIVIRPERVRIHGEFPPGDFDTVWDDPTLAPVEKAEQRSEFYQARAWTAAEVSCQIGPRGDVRRIWGAVPQTPMLHVMGFTPGDFPALPPNPVHLGDAWEVEVGLQNGGVLKGTATYRLIGHELHDGRRVDRVEGIAKWTQYEDSFATQAEFGPTLSVSLFDSAAGYFLEEISVTSGQMRLGLGDPFLLQVGTVRYVTKIAEPTAKAVDNGEYVFAMRNEDVIPLQLGGEQLRAADDVPTIADGGLRLSFFHTWEDANEDRLPDHTELKGVNTRYQEGDVVRALLTAANMRDLAGRCEIVDSQGKKLATQPFQIHQGPISYVVIEQTELPAGVYFFEWYVNDDYLIRIPVQIHTSNVEDDERPDSVRMSPGVTDLPDRVAVVVAADQGHIYADQVIVDTEPFGTVLKVSKLRDEWLFVERPEGSGWIHGSEVLLRSEAIPRFSGDLIRNPRRAELFRARGNLYLSLHRGQEAIEDFDDAIHLDPRDALAYVGRGLAWSELDNGPRALADFDMAVQLAPDDARPLQLRARLRTQRGHFDAALADCELALQLNESDAMTYVVRGEALNGQGQAQQAMLSCNRALQLNPRLPDAYVLRGNLWSQQGDPGQALTDYEQATRLDPDHQSARLERGRLLLAGQQYAKAIEDLNQSIAARPQDAELYFRRGTAWLYLDELDRSIADLTRAIELDPQKASSYTNRGVALARRAESDRALADFNRAIELDPLEPTPYRNRAKLHAQLGNYREAIADADQLIQLEPNDATHWISRGMARYALRLTDQAIEDFSEAIRRLPMLPDLYAFRGAALNQEGRYDAAIEDFNTAIALDPRVAELYSDRGFAWGKKGEYEKALADIEQALQIDPQLLAAKINRAWLWMMQGDCGRALEEVEQVIALQPQDPAGYNGRALILATCPEAAHRNPVEAIHNATQACEMSGWTWAHYLDTLAAAYAAAGDFGAAVHWQTRALEIDPRDPDHGRQDRLAQFEAGKPYHQPPTMASETALTLSVSRTAGTDHAAPAPDDTPQISAPALDDGLPTMTLSEALSAPAEKLAERYLAIKCVAEQAWLARKGAAVNTTLDGSPLRIDRQNVDRIVAQLEEQRKIYEQAIELRGYRTLAPAYEATAAAACRGLWVSSGPTLIEQAGFNFTLTNELEKHTGVIVDSALFVQHQQNPQVALVGTVGEGRIDFFIAGKGPSAQLTPPGCTLTLVETQTLHPPFARALVGRAVAKLQQDRNYAGALADLREAGELDPDFVTSYLLRAQLLAACPDPAFRDGAAALQAAQRACQLMGPNQQWFCQDILASAYAEQGDFTTAATHAAAAAARALSKNEGKGT